MTTYTFVYSRTKNIDYRLITQLADPDFNSEQRSHFAQLAEWAVTSHVDNGPQEYLLARFGRAILWGTVCMSRDLSSVCDVDRHDRPIRGFFGIAIADYNGEALPVSNDFFAAVKQSVIPQIYDSPNRETSEAVAIHPTSTDVIVPTMSSFAHILNFDSSRLRLHSIGTDWREAVTVAPVAGGDISIYVGDAESGPVNNIIPVSRPQSTTEDVKIIDSKAELRKAEEELRKAEEEVRKKVEEEAERRKKAEEAAHREFEKQILLQRMEEERLATEHRRKKRILISALVAVCLFLIVLVYTHTKNSPNTPTQIEVPSPQGDANMPAVQPDQSSETVMPAPERNQQNPQKDTTL